MYVPSPRGFVTWTQVWCPEDPPLLGQFLLSDLSLDRLHIFATMSTADVDGSGQMTFLLKLKLFCDPASLYKPLGSKSLS